MNCEKHPVKARIYIYLESEGGMSKDFLLGMRFDFFTRSNLGAICQIIKCLNYDTEKMERGRIYEILLEVLCNDNLKNELFDGQEFTLNGGKLIFAKGVII